MSTANSFAIGLSGVPLHDLGFGCVGRTPSATWPTPASPCWSIWPTATTRRRWCRRWWSWPSLPNSTYRRNTKRWASPTICWLIRSGVHAVRLTAWKSLSLIFSYQGHGSPWGSIKIRHRTWMILENWCTSGGVVFTRMPDESYCRQLGSLFCCCTCVTYFEY